MKLDNRDCTILNGCKVIKFFIQYKGNYLTIEFLLIELLEMVDYQV